MYEGSTRHPTAMSRRVLKFETAIRDLRICAFCPVIRANSPAAVSQRFLSIIGEPVPMDTTTLLSRGTAIGFSIFKSALSFAAISLLY